jgi:hypothetical protein
VNLLTPPEFSGFESAGNAKRPATIGFLVRSGIAHPLRRPVLDSAVLQQTPSASLAAANPTANRPGGEEPPNTPNTRTLSFSERWPVFACLACFAVSSSACHQAPIRSCR